MRALSAIERSDVVLLVIDATTGVIAQDAHVAGFILEAYKSVVVIVNKWDAVPDKDSMTMVRYTEEIREQLHFLDYVPVLFISALNGQRVGKVLPTALAVAAQRKLRIPTGELNRLVQEAVAAHAPTAGGRQVRLYYATQAAVAPPTFIVFVNNRDLVHFSYARYLENRIRASYPFEGTPIRLIFRNRGEGQTSESN
jgi:GTPase